jgi:hypothetical protein
LSVTFIVFCWRSFEPDGSDGNSTLYFQNTSFDGGLMTRFPTIYS